MRAMASRYPSDGDPGSEKSKMVVFVRGSMMTPFSQITEKSVGSCIMARNWLSRSSSLGGVSCCQRCCR
jgi:hypothetical protein